MTVYLDFSIGPVQLFVAQSRRTRDLWGSSYLLSFLSAHAVKAAIDAGGTPARPNFDIDREELLLWICDRRVGQKPRIGSIPNHFIMQAEDPAHARRIADAAQQAITAAWKKVCDVVWDTYVEPVHARGQGTRQIWKRQLEDFWEIAWIVAPTEPGLIRRRKHWRTHCLPDEPGDKCMVMPDFQELSGHVRTGSSTRDQQLAFWEALREGGKLGPLDLREGERLSAVALVKRLYPKVAEEALGWSLDTSHWPSTVYVAALPWIRKAATLHTQLASRYAEVVTKLAPNAIAEKKQPALAGTQCHAAGDFARLDANFFHATFIEDPRLCPLTEAGAGSAQVRADLIKQLKELQEAMKGPPSSFYALLLADGDRLGELVGTLGGTRVGDALRTFTGEVQDIVRSCDGVTIYAGGDDVLAMLPVDRALECARRLADRYEKAFEPDSATLSAAVCFAHIRMPLRSVLRESHRLLDQVAKRDNGRASLTVGVLKRGGLHCEWTTTWIRHGADAVERISQLANHLGGEADEPGFSSSLLYRLHATIGLLCDWPQWRPGMWTTALSELDLETFLAAEVRRSLSSRTDDDDCLEQVTNEITSALVNVIPRSRNGDAPPALGVDALLVARFIASKGEEVSA